MSTYVWVLRVYDHTTSEWSANNPNAWSIYVYATRPSDEYIRGWLKAEGFSTEAEWAIERQLVLPTIGGLE